MGMSYLMKTAQATKDASSNPTSVLAFHRVARSLQPDPRARVYLCEFLVKPIVEADN